MRGTSAVAKFLGKALRSHGLVGTGRHWEAAFRDVTWLIELDVAPITHRLGIDVGLSVSTLGDNTPTRPTDCPVLIGAENMVLGSHLDRAAILTALDLDSRLDDDDRVDCLIEIADELARYVTSRRTFDSVRTAYASGEFKSAFIRKDARAFLEQGNTSR